MDPFFDESPLSSIDNSAFNQTQPNHTVPGGHGLHDDSFAFQNGPN